MWIRFTGIRSNLCILLERMPLRPDGLELRVADLPHSSAEMVSNAPARSCLYKARSWAHTVYAGAEQPLGLKTTAS